MVPCIVVVKDGVVDENILCVDSADAEKRFLDKCAERLSNWDEYSAEDREACLDDGYAEYVTGSVCLSWAMTPNEIAGEPDA